MARLFDVSVDYLTGEGQLSAFDKETVKCIEAIESLDTDTRRHLFFLIDNVVQNFRTRQAFG